MVPAAPAMAPAPVAPPVVPLAQVAPAAPAMAPAPAAPAVVPNQNDNEDSDSSSEEAGDDLHGRRIILHARAVQVELSLEIIEF